MEAKKEDYGKKMPLISKIGYGLGDAGANFCYSSISLFIMIYCTDTLGVSAAIIGTLMMVSKILDGFSDIFMGRIIDATHSKMGKARFWYFISIFPCVICTYLIFNIPSDLGDHSKYTYFFIVYTLLGAVFYTMNNIAYSALTALCTEDPDERVQMGSYRYICAAVALLVMSFVTTGIVEYFGGGQQGWRAVSIIYSILGLIFLLIPVFSVKELPEKELSEGEASIETKGELGFISSIVMLLKNKYFLMILALYLILYGGNGVVSGMGIYYATYQWGDASLLGSLSMAMIFTQMVVLLFVPQLIKKLGMRNASMWGHAVGIAGAVILIFSGYIGSFALVLLGIALKWAGGAPETGALNALIAEADEYNYLKTGYRLTGTIYSCSSVGIKVGTGIGTALCGFLLEWGGYDGMTATQTASTVAVINWSYILFSAIIPVLSIVVLYFLKVEQENKMLRAAKK